MRKLAVTMLDIIARSQRGRVCEYSRDGQVLTTPCMIRSGSEGPVGVEVAEGGRTLRFFGTSVTLERGLLTTASSGMVGEPVLEGPVEVVRLPLPETIEIQESAEVVVVPNAYELRKDPRRIIDVVVRLREAMGFGRILCMMGLGEPSTVALLTYMGVDVFDDSLPRAAGLEHVRLMPEAEVSMDEGDVAGARININSKELSGAGHLAFGLSGGLNTQTAGATLLLPDGMNAFGGARGSWPDAASLDAQFQKLDFGLFRNRLNPSRHDVPVNQSYGIAGGYSFRLGKRELPLSFFATLGHSTNFNYGTEAIRDAGTNNRNIYKDQTGKKSEQSVKQLGMANLTFSVPGRHKVAYNLLAVHDSHASVGNYMGTNSKFDETDYAEAGGLYQRQQINENLLVVNQLAYDWTPSVRHALGVGVAYNTVRGDEPDRRDLYMGLDTENRALVPITGEGYNNRSYSELKEKDLNVRAGYTFRLTDDRSNPSDLRVGYKGRIVRDDFRAADYGFYAGGRPQLDVDFPDYDGYVNGEGVHTFVNHIPSSYTVDKDIHTGYVESTYRFPVGLTANLGVRYDHVDMVVDYDIQRRLQGRNDFQEHFVLPSLNLRYDLNVRHALRLGLSRTYTLPQAKEISPYTYIGAAFNSVGNPDLRPSDNYNVDLKWDWYLGDEEVVTLAGFYKYIADPISRIQTTGGGTYLRYENVSNHATVAGAEIDIRKKLFNLAGRSESRHSLTAGVNASYIYTDVRVQNSTNLRNEDKGSQLEGAAPWLVNADLTYQWSRGHRSVTAALVFNYFSDRLYSIGMEDYQDVMEEGVGTLDFVASARLTKRLSLSFKAKNLLNPTHELTRRATLKERDDEGNYHYVGKGDKLVMNSYRNAIDLSLGLSMKF